MPLLQGCLDLFESADKANPGIFYCLEEEVRDMGA
jgi:myosin heavy subunit